MLNSQMPKARDRGLVVQESHDEVLVYDTETNKAHCLNNSSAIVWRSCDGTKTVTDIVYEFERNNAGKVTEDFVWLAIDQLRSKGLLESKVESKFPGKSRREVLKTIGLASVVALPVIASLVAPPNALAATSCNCSADTDCALPAMCTTTMCDNVGTTATFTCIA